jgi:hypothetical protein
MAVLNKEKDSYDRINGCDIIIGGYSNSKSILFGLS